MSTRHSVAAGEHLTQIAEKYGFRDFKTIWDHPDNAELKQQRADPHVLHPGDSVMIPDKVLRHDARPTDKAHRFRVSSRPLMLRIALTDFDNEPIPDTKCELVVDGVLHRLTSDGKGLIETPIPRSAKEGVLTVPDLGIEHALKIGHLDPVTEDSGWQGRLVNLGYYAGAVGDDDAVQLRHAIEEFQCDHKLPVTGELDGATQAKLLEQHGA